MKLIYLILFTFLCLTCQPLKTFAQTSANKMLAAPVNDNCSGAINFNGGDPCTGTAGTTTNATASGGVPAVCAGNADDDVWYKFTAINTDEKITVSCNSGFDPVVQVFTGSCASLTSAFCQDDAGDGANEVLDLTGFGIGSTYYVRVLNYGTGSGSGDFNICIKGTPPANNDEPCDATLLPEVTSACVYGIYNLFTATNTATPGSPGCGWNGKDIWFKAVVPPNGKIDISTYHISGGIDDPTMAVYSGSVCSSLTKITCDDNSGDPSAYMPYISLSGRTPGETLWIRVAYSSSMGNGKFKLCVSTPSNDECSSSLFVCDLNGFSGSTLASYTVDMNGLAGENGGPFGTGGTSIENNSWLAFTAGATSASLNVTIADCWVGDGIQMQILSGTCGNAGSFSAKSSFLETNTSQTITATGLTVGNTYYLMIDGYAGDVCNYTISGTSGIKSLTVSPSTANVCNGSSINLTANPVGFGTPTYSWYSDPPGFTGNTASVTVNPVEYTKYYVNVTGACNDMQEASSTVNVPNPNKEFTWTGGGVTTNDSWTDPNNWGSIAGCLPDCNNSAIVPSVPTSSATNFPKINSSVACKNLIVLNDPNTGDSNYSLSVYNSGNLSICGNLLFYGSMPPNTHYSSYPNSRITFSGASSQYLLNSASSSGDFPSVTLNNSTGLTLLDGKDGNGTFKNLTINPSGNLILTSGKLTTLGARKAVVNNTATNAISGHGISAYINGRLMRYVSASGLYDFPVGNKDGYQLASINLTSVSGGLNALNVFFEPAYDESDLAQSPNVLDPSDVNREYNGFLNNGGINASTGTAIPDVWTVTPNAGSANYDITVNGRNFDNASGFSHTVGKRNTPTACSPSWAAPGTLSTNTNSGGVVSAKRTGVSGFSQFVILKGLNVLPVTLIDFNAKCNNDKITFYWSTATELNNDHFILERANANKMIFEPISSIKGNGTSNSINTYSSVIENKGSDYYYRLRQIDYDGKETVYQTIHPNCLKTNSIKDAVIYPNPFNDEILITCPECAGKTFNIKIYSTVGTLVYEKTLENTTIINEKILVKDLSKGVYFVELSDGVNKEVKPLVKN